MISIKRGWIIVFVIFLPFITASSIVKTDQYQGFVTIVSNQDYFQMENDEMIIDIYKDSVGYDEIYYPDGSIAIYSQRIVVQEWKEQGQGSWNQIGVPQETGYYPIEDGYVVWRYYTDFNGVEYNVSYQLSRNSPMKYTVDFKNTNQIPSIYRILWSLDGIVNNDYIIGENQVIYGDIIIDFNDVSDTWGNITSYSHTTTGNGRKADYYFEVGEQVDFTLDPTITVLENDGNINFTSDLFGTGKTSYHLSFNGTSNIEFLYFKLPNSSTQTHATFDLSGVNDSFLGNFGNITYDANQGWRNIWMNNTEMLAIDASNFHLSLYQPITNDSKVRILTGTTFNADFSNPGTSMRGIWNNGTHIIFSARDTGNLHKIKINRSSYELTNASLQSPLMFNLSTLLPVGMQSDLTIIEAICGDNDATRDEVYVAWTNNTDYARNVLTEFNTTNATGEWKYVKTINLAEEFGGSISIRDCAIDNDKNGYIWLLTTGFDVVKFNKAGTYTGFKDTRFNTNYYGIGILSTNLYIGNITHPTTDELVNFTFNQSFPDSMLIQIGSTTIFNQPSTLQTSNTTADFASAITTYKSTCTEDANGHCDVYLNFTSNSGGIDVENISLNYTSDESGAFTIYDWWRKDRNIYDEIDNIQNMTKMFINTATPNVDLSITGYFIDGSSTECNLIRLSDLSSLGSNVNTSTVLGTFCQYDTELTIDNGGGGTFVTTMLDDKIYGNGTAFEVNKTAQVGYTVEIDMNLYEPDMTVNPNDANRNFDNISFQVNLSDTLFEEDARIEINVLGAWITLNSTAQCSNSYGVGETSYSTTTIGSIDYNVCHLKSGLFKDYFKVNIETATNTDFQTVSASYDSSSNSSASGGAGGGGGSFEFTSCNWKIFRPQNRVIQQTGYSGYQTNEVQFQIYNNESSDLTFQYTVVDVDCELDKNSQVIQGNSFGVNSLICNYPESVDEGTIVVRGGTCTESINVKLISSLFGAVIIYLSGGAGILIALMLWLSIFVAIGGIIAVIK